MRFPAECFICRHCGKNDAADAEALCKAMSRPTMRFVPVNRQGALIWPAVSCDRAQRPDL